MNMRKNGFSLVELLVAITISMVALVAVSASYVSSRQTNKVQGMQNPLTEEGRYAISMIQRIVSQAGFRQTPVSAMPADRIEVAANVLTARFEADGRNLIACDGSVPLAGAAQTLVIQKTNTGKLQCGTVDWIAPAISGTGNSSEVVDFLVKFGIDTGPALTPENFGCGIANAGTKLRDCIADSYVSTLPLGVNADQIVSVKVCLLLRSEAVDSSVMKPALVKNCSGTDIANTKDDRKLYRAFWTTILLKNR
ncbi:PilW family protein [Undibacterium sp.]|uniref:PilW family protein n=1 Tax=Undibacterium sp. TaxID=1914977 RepID=UPI0025F97FF7|nr:PilW family protein [Undibacterium sp.]